MSAYAALPLLTAAVWLAAASAAPAQTLQLDFSDKDNGLPVSCRVTFTQSPRKVIPPRGSLTSGPTILGESTLLFKPRPGDYTLAASRGIEFADVRGGFQVARETVGSFDVVITRTTDMHAEGWYSGDLASSLPADELARWAAADAIDLTVRMAADAEGAKTAPTADGSPSPGDALPTVWHSYRLAGGEDPADGRVAIALHPLRRELSPPAGVDGEGERGGGVELPSALQSAAELPAEDWLVELSEIWERDLPLVLAAIQPDAVQVLSHHLQVGRGATLQQAFYNPDPVRFRGESGLGRLVEFIYWQMLEAGFEAAPTAASYFAADGRTHLGYNRTYVWLDPAQPKTPEAWLASLAAGQTTVTNGPLLRARIDGQPPGVPRTPAAAAAVPLDLATELTVHEDVEYLDVIYNGRSIYQARLEDHIRRGNYPPLQVDESGWLLLRVVAARTEGYGVAMTAPTFYRFGGQRRVSREAVQFFQDWLDRAAADIESDAAAAAQYAPLLRSAKRFWARLALEANVP